VKCRNVQSRLLIPHNFSDTISILEYNCAFGGSLAVLMGFVLAFEEPRALVLPANILWRMSFKG
jgi:hypothetical protein